MQVILQQIWKENFGTSAGVHLIEGVRLIWGLLDTGLTVSQFTSFESTTTTTSFSTK